MTTTKGEQETNAEETLAYIRETIETASGFTAVSGRGLIGVGILGLIASLTIYLQSRQAPDPLIWLPTAILSIGFSSAATARKARRPTGSSSSIGPACPTTTTTRRPPPRGYEARLQRYFESRD